MRLSQGDYNALIAENEKLRAQIDRDRQAGAAAVLTEELRTAKAEEERRTAVEALEKILFLWDCSTSQGFAFLNNIGDVPKMRAILAPWTDEYERKNHADEWAFSWKEGEL